MLYESVLSSSRFFLLQNLESDIRIDLLSTKEKKLMREILLFG